MTFLLCKLFLQPDFKGHRSSRLSTRPLAFSLPTFSSFLLIPSPMFLMTDSFSSLKYQLQWHSKRAPHDDPQSSSLPSIFWLFHLFPHDLYYSFSLFSFLPAPPWFFFHIFKVSMPFFPSLIDFISQQMPRCIFEHCGAETGSETREVESRPRGCSASEGQRGHLSPGIQPVPLRDARLLRLFFGMCSLGKLYFSEESLLLKKIYLPRECEDTLYGPIKTFEHAKGQKHCVQGTHPPCAAEVSQHRCCG